MKGRGRREGEIIYIIVIYHYFAYRHVRTSYVSPKYVESENMGDVDAVQLESDAIT